MTWKVALVPKEAVEDIWPTAVVLLASAFDRSSGRVNAEAAWKLILEDRYLLWVAYDDEAAHQIRAAFLTRTAVYPCKKYLAIDFCGGSGMAGWLGVALDTFQRCAEDSGLDGAEFLGRTGWSRAVARYGWRHGLVLCEIDTIAGMSRE